MKLCAAQTKAFPGDIDRNITQHLGCVHAAIEHGAAAILFPELSISGYEPTLANALATTVDDARFAPFQDLSRAGNITIALGAPVQMDVGVGIGLFIYHPDKAPQVYLKQRLHADEDPFFVPGSGDLPFEVQGKR
ncbi:MAG: carbon-nitrogen hydrolase family protein, partial [Bacteroidota bacterium]